MKRSLQESLIRLAYSSPNLRHHLIPILAADSHHPGDVWKTDDGNWRAMNPKRSTKSFGDDHDAAKAYAKGKDESIFGGSSKLLSYSDIEDKFTDRQIERLQDYVMGDRSKYELGNEQWGVDLVEDLVPGKKRWDDLSDKERQDIYNIPATKVSKDAIQTVLSPINKARKPTGLGDITITETGDGYEIADKSGTTTKVQTVRDFIKASKAIEKSTDLILNSLKKAMEDAM